MPSSPDLIPKWLVDLAQILSAIGTCGAVIVALYLAASQRRPRLRSVLTDVVIVDAITPQNSWPRFLRINVVNIGACDAVVTGAAWTSTWSRKGREYYQGFISVHDGAPHGAATLPTTLKPGQSASYYLPVSGRWNWFDQVEQKGFFPEALTTRQALNALQLTVSTSVGTRHKTSLSPDFVDDLWRAQEKHLRANALRVNQAPKHPTRATPGAQA